MGFSGSDQVMLVTLEFEAKAQSQRIHVIAPLQGRCLRRPYLVWMLESGSLDRQHMDPSRYEVLDTCIGDSEFPLVGFKAQVQTLRIFSGLGLGSSFVRNLPLQGTAIEGGSFPGCVPPRGCTCMHVTSVAPRGCKHTHVDMRFSQWSTRLGPVLKTLQAKVCHIGVCRRCEVFLPS